MRNGVEQITVVTNGNGKARRADKPTCFEISGKGQAALARIVGKSAKIQSLKKQIALISQYPNTPVLITGETGTGKELVANALHACSSRSNRPMIKINCATIPESLAESQLFGHVKGAFSGAIFTQVGLVEAANGGTLFLDEIGSLSPRIQPKLLRVLQDGSYIPVGGRQEKHASVWILSACNRPLLEKIRAGDFRDDLYYRLNSTEIHLPALREREADVPELVKHFTRNLLHADHPEIQSAIGRLVDELQRNGWPGNIRHLEQRLLALPITIRTNKDRVLNNSQSVSFFGIGQNLPSLNEIEEAYVMEVLQRTNFNITRAARVLRIDRRTLQRKIQSLD